MNRNQVAVLGAIRNADEHELEAWELAPMVRLSIHVVRAALRDLRRAGLVSRRVEGKHFFYSWRH